MGNELPRNFERLSQSGQVLHLLLSSLKKTYRARGRCNSPASFLATLANLTERSAINRWRRDDHGIWTDPRS